MTEPIDLASTTGIRAEDVQCVFLLGTPLQFLNAFEALYHFGCDPSRTLVVMLDNHTASNSFHMRRLAEEQAWPHLWVLPTGRRGLLVRLRWKRRSLWRSQAIRAQEVALQKLLGIPLEQLILGRQCQRQMKQLARSLPQLEYLFIGYFGSPIMRHFANSTEAENIYILEEGVNQLHLYDDLHADKPKFGRQYYFGVFGNFMRRILFNVNLRAPDPLRFYTAYNLEDTEKVRVEKNTYAKFRERIQEASHSEEVFFLGEWLTAWNCCTDEEYAAVMEKVREYYSGRRIIYVPHRRTPHSTRERLSTVPGIEVRSLGGPVELELAASNRRPHTVAAFFSSAIFNISMLFGDEIKLDTFKVPVFYPTPEIEHFIEDFYSYADRYFRESVRVHSLT